MRVRKVDSAGDMTFGRGSINFWHNQPEGVAQVVMSRLKLWTGEWFLDRTEGTDWQTKVLGKRTEGVRDAVIRSRVLGTPDVTRIASYDSLLDRNTRIFTVAATIDTTYGPVKIKEPM